jgi:hypothetical protein
MTTPREAVFGDDLGGVGKQTGGQPIPNIGDTPDDAVTQDRPGATADGEPVSPYLAARRYGAAAGQGYMGTNPDEGAP